MNPKRVLVAYGSKAGATAGIAEEIGRTLREDGFDAVVPPVRGVARRMRKLGARGHMTFGGSMSAETSDPVVRHLVSRGKGGDFRNPERIREWAHHIGTELGAAR
ncbi:hypothetical protein [Streptomyces sp. NPDC001927]